MADRWVPALPGSPVEHLEGVPWFDAPAPPAEHEHKPQSRRRSGLDLFERCACGAGRYDGHRPWFDTGTGRRTEAPSNG